MNLANIKSQLRMLIETAERELEKYEKEDEYSIYTYNEVDYIKEKSEDFIATLEYLSKPYKEGYLKLGESDRYEVCFDDHNTRQLTCGSPLELYMPDYDESEPWQIGRVEHRQGAYYFYGGDSRFLQYGMTVRVR